MKPANDFWHPLNARRGHDVGDVCDRLWMGLDTSFANAFGTGLGGPEGPEPGKPSPRYRAPSLSQEQPREPAQPNKRAGRNS
jgi:hypothetical protein